MKLKVSFFSTFLLITLLNQILCSSTYNINDVSTWKLTNISDTSDESKYEINKLSKFPQEYNQLSLQITDSKIVFVTYGYDNYQSSDSQIYMQIAIFDNKGKIQKSVTFQGLFNKHVALSLTNVEGEFVFMYSNDDYTFITFYDQNLEVTRDVQKEKLNTNNCYNANISLGKDLIYVVVYCKESTEYNQVLVLDLSDTSTYSILQSHSYEIYTNNQYGAYSIQAYKDDSAILHFYNENQSDEKILVQVQYNSKGEKKSGYPQEKKSDLILVQLQFVMQKKYLWTSSLHQNKEMATLIASDNQSTLLIYTYGKDGTEICSDLIDITGYKSQNYFYGIVGDQGWIYIDDLEQNEGHFLIFEPKKCQIDFKNIGEGTGLLDGMAGSFVDYNNGKILMFELGNLVDQQDSSQMYLQANLYDIGSYKSKDDDDEDNDDAFILGINFLTTIIFLAFFMI